ncbi:MAG: DUF3311 domain-containing protein [Pirellulales bacterium]|nr:DUF3311 domain-containing protein [Pirellulales bacterium]
MCELQLAAYRVPYDVEKRSSGKRMMKKLCMWCCVALLLIFHQDNWFWTDGTLVFGFLPIGLLYHAGISLAAAGLWFTAICVIWPKDVEYSENELAEGSLGKEAEL